MPPLLFDRVENAPDSPPFALRKPLSIPLSGELADPVHEVRRPPRRTPRRPFFSPAARPVSNDAGRLTLMALGAPEPTMTPKRSMQRVGVFSKHPRRAESPHRSDRVPTPSARPLGRRFEKAPNRTFLRSSRDECNWTANPHEDQSRVCRLQGRTAVRLLVAAGCRRPSADSNLTERRRGPLPHVVVRGIRHRKNL